MEEQENAPHAHSTFARWLRSRRAELMQHQRVAAKKVGVSVTSWQQWESGNKRPVKVAHATVLAGWASKNGLPRVKPVEVFLMLIEKQA